MRRGVIYMRININGNEEYYYDECDFGNIIRKYLGIQAEREYEYFLNKAREEVAEEVASDSMTITVDENSLGKWVSGRRIKLGYSQSELAKEVANKYYDLHGKKLNVSTLANLISKYERGERNISYKYREAFFRALDVQYSELEEECKRQYIIKSKC